jgi:hypothetical protein
MGGAGADRDMGINPKSEEPKSERNPKSEIRKSGGGQAQTARVDGRHFESDSPARQGTVKVGQTNWESCGGKRLATPLSPGRDW